ncbi:MAG: hypothetical protein Q9184_003270 [Pyrenodesmia sp. 2 TL-2023]
MGNSPQKSIVANGQESLLRQLSDLYLTGDYHDLTIACQEWERKVHRAVEGNLALIKLDDLHPVMVEKLIYYLYHSEYDDNGYWQDDEDDNNHDLGLKVMKEGEEVQETAGELSEILGQHGKGNEEEGADEGNEEEDTNEAEQEEPQQQDSQLLALNAGMYIIGDRFHLSQLKDLAKKKFSAALIERWDKENLPIVIRTIYENTLASDRDLHDCLVPTLLQHKKAPREAEDFMEVVKTHGDFAVDLVDVWGGEKAAGNSKIKLTSKTQVLDGYSWGFRNDTGKDGIIYSWEE